ncbi:MAG TPA: OmpA family protein [Kofleriaceae bacterium]|nr:OmpA family protein [Kofleriaceae bacterium]
MRAGVIALATVATVSAVPRASRAEPDAEARIEASGFVGMGWFSDDSGLGNSWAAEQVPHTAPVFGVRGGFLAVPALVERGDKRLSLAVEGELALATSYTGSTFPSEGGRMSYFAPVIGWRAHAVLRLAGFETVQPQLVAGGGAQTVASSSPFMAKETEGIVYWGPGAVVPITDRWRVRFDARHSLVPARDGGRTSNLEAQLGVVATFGGTAPRKPHTVEPPPGPEHPPVVDNADTDGDGIPDRVDRCPKDKELVNGIDDQDGCPEADPDGDGLIGAADKCPDQPEDFDKFTDEDGCPDPDNDGDGVADAKDACPREAETLNGFDDQDGCPDKIPDDVTKALAAGAAIKFEAKRARLTQAAKDALLPVQNMLGARANLRIVIVGHPDAAAGEDLAKRRAEAVKWYLVDEGLVASRIDVKVGAVAKSAIELTIAPPSK